MNAAVVRGQGSGRASPLPAEDRRTMIATAAIPLFIEQGASVTTRQLADHLGIAEGTIFRAFGDKDALVRAVVSAYFEQARDLVASGLELPGVGLAEKLRITIRNARERARGVHAMLSLLDTEEAIQYVRQRRGSDFEDAIASGFASESDELNLPPERLGSIIRLIAIAASAPHLGAGAPLTDDELVDFALYGLLGRPAPDASDDAPGKE